MQNFRNFGPPRPYLNHMGHFGFRNRIRILSPQTDPCGSIYRGRYQILYKIQCLVNYFIKSLTLSFTKCLNQARTGGRPPLSLANEMGSTWVPNEEDKKSQLEPGNCNAALVVTTGSES